MNNIHSNATFLDKAIGKKTDAEDQKDRSSLGQALFRILQFVVKLIDIKELKKLISKALA